MFQVNPDKVDTFYFKLHNPQQQITAYVDDCIRAQARQSVHLILPKACPGLHTHTQIYILYMYEIMCIEIIPPHLQRQSNLKLAST